MLRLISTASLAVILSGLSAAAFAATSGTMAVTPSDKIMHTGDLRYACTGVGIAARQDPAWAKFPLKMVFTDAKGAYLGDVVADLTDSNGKAVVVAHCQGPWLLADLQPGTYTATLDVPNGHEKSVKFKVAGKKQTQVIVPFKSLTND